MSSSLEKASLSLSKNVEGRWLWTTALRSAIGIEDLLSWRDRFLVIRFPSGDSASMPSAILSLQSSTRRSNSSARLWTAATTRAFETTFLIMLRTLLTVRWFRAAFVSIDCWMMSSSSELLDLKSKSRSVTAPSYKIFHNKMQMETYE